MSFATPYTLLHDLQQTDPPPDKWEQFHQLYAPILIAWGKQQGFQTDDALDIAQDVLAVVARTLSRFDETQGGSFRSWLYTITKRKAADYRDHLRRSPRVGLDGVPEPVAPNILSDEDDYRVALVHRACQLIRDDFEERTWEAFVRCQRNGERAGDVAAALGVDRQTVYAACNRVLVRLRSVITGLTEGGAAGI